jgi:hypothetical protein
LPKSTLATRNFWTAGWNFIKMGRKLLQVSMFTGTDFGRNQWSVAIVIKEMICFA